MKRIHIAINEGLNQHLIDFGNDKLKKSSGHMLHNFKELHFGDYVLYDSIIGYNNYIGKKVAICINDEPGKELYIVLNHPLLKNRFIWADRDTRLYNDRVPNFNNGWETTLYILKNYSTDLKGSIWELLGNDEYIPSKNELVNIYDICKKSNHLYDAYFTLYDYWSASQSRELNEPNCAISLYTRNGIPDSDCKDLRRGSVVLLHIN